jgi:tetratricopeptide (TPR) repeat protein
MVKAFLSHSSNDKKSYIEIVARKLGDSCIYDDYTFESGMESIEEILRGMTKTDLFVLFLSDSSLESDWVKTEILEARRLHEAQQIQRIFPIIIDSNISHEDPRIPDWLRKTYNLKLVSRPVVAAGRIKQRLKEIVWSLYPSVQQRNNIFVGRNELIRAFEDRVHDFNLETPISVIASGIPEVGRRSLMYNCCKKTNLYDVSYEPQQIALKAQESIEDFIHKIYSLGLSSDSYEETVTDLMMKSLTEKLYIAVELVSEIQEAREKILILDDQCIVDSDGMMAKWFIQLMEIISASKLSNQLTFLIASSRRIARKNKIFSSDRQYIYSINVPELDSKERGWMLREYSRLERLELDVEELSFFTQILTGYPRQVLFLMELIKSEGASKLRRNPSDIQEYSRNKAQVLLRKIENDPEKMELLYFLSEFDSGIAYEFIFSIVDEKTHAKYIDEFLTSAICEIFGASREYIRVNDTIKDYVSRMRIDLPPRYKRKLETHLNSFLETYETEEKDASDFLYSLKQALKEGKTVNSRYLIPSHFLKAIKELYDKQNRYSDVIVLADRALENSENLDDGIKSEIRSILLRSLARLARKHPDLKTRFLKEINLVDNSFQHNFLFGFYYRLLGVPDEALKRLNKALEIKPGSPIAKRELAEVYIYLGEYDKATVLAQKNYEEQPSNPYHIQRYFTCLIKKTSQSPDDEAILDRLIGDIQRSQSASARETSYNLRALYEAFQHKNIEAALHIIDEGINTFPNNSYLIISRFDICFEQRDLNAMESSVSLLKKRIDEESYLYPALVKAESSYLAAKGDTQKAVSLINQNLRNFPRSYVVKLEQKVRSIQPIPS